MLYILDRLNGTPKSVENISAYSISTDTTLLAASTVSTINAAEKGDFVYIDNEDYFGVVTGSAVNQLQVSSLYSMFDRRILKPTGPEATFEAELLKIINANFINIADTFFQYPFEASKSSSFATGTYVYKPDSDGCVNVLSVYKDMHKRQGTTLDFVMMADGIKILITNPINEGTQKILDLSKLNVISEEQQGESVGRVSTRNTSNSTSIHYYGYTDGSFSTNDSVGGKTRLHGRYEWIVGDTAATLVDSAESAFAENKYNHLIEFSAPSTILGQTLRLNDWVKVKGRNGTIYNSYISCVTATSNSKLINYKTGNLRVSLTDKLRRMKV